MNRLLDHKRLQILHMLVEGSSMRSTSRVARVASNTGPTLCKMPLPSAQADPTSAGSMTAA